MNIGKFLSFYDKKGNLIEKEKKKNLFVSYKLFLTLIKCIW